MADINKLPTTATFTPRTIVYATKDFVVCSGNVHPEGVESPGFACRYTDLSKETLEAIGPLVLPNRVMTVDTFNELIASEFKTERGKAGNPKAVGLPQWFILPECFVNQLIDTKTNGLTQGQDTSFALSV